MTIRTMSLDTLLREYIKLAEVIFKPDGSINACGRKACIELIELAEQLESDKRFGDKTTGFMDVREIKQLYIKCKYLTGKEPNIKV